MDTDRGPVDTGRRRRQSRADVPAPTRFVAGDRRAMWKRARWSVVRAVAVSLVLFGLYAFAPLGEHVDNNVMLQLAGTLLIIVVVAALEVRLIVGSADPEVRAVEAVAVLVPLVLLPFSAAYYVTSVQSPGDFSEKLSRLDAFYFTLTTFATVGFGDIVPTSESARVMVTVQIALDLVLIGLIAKVLFGAAQRRRRDLGQRRGTDDDTP